jgi:hypothetical protein
MGIGLQSIARELGVSEAEAAGGAQALASALLGWVATGTDEKEGSCRSHV